MKLEPLALDHDRLTLSAPDGFSPMNTSLVRVGETLYACVRCVDYDLADYSTEHGTGRPRDPSGIQHSRYRMLGMKTGASGLFILDFWNLDTSACWPAEYEKDGTKLRVNSQGYCDIRLFRGPGGIIHFTATCLHVTGFEGLERQVRGWLTDDLRKVAGVLPLDFPFGVRHEKNWLPFMAKDFKGEPEVFFVHSYDPLTIFSEKSTYRWDIGGARRPEDQKARGLDSRSASASAPSSLLALSPSSPSLWRGGARPVPLPDGSLLFMVHQTYQAGLRRAYSHRFVRLEMKGADLWDADVSVSPEFVMHHVGVEFAMGLDVHNGVVTITYGVEDKESWYMQVPLDAVLGMLRPG